MNSELNSSMLEFTGNWFIDVGIWGTLKITMEVSY